MKDIFDISNRVAVITGGAGGIGKAIAEAYLTAGAIVVICDINQEIGRACCEEWRAEGYENTIFIQTNVRSPESLEDMAEQVYGLYGKIDILVNCAGILCDGTVETTEVENWKQIMEIDLDGIFYSCKAVLKYMKAQKRGVVINIASSSGMVGFPFTSISYCTAKGGVYTFTRQMAMQEGKAGIRVNALAPGSTYTDLIKYRDEKLIKSQEEYIPMGRLGRVEEQAAAALFLASDASSYLNGEIMHVNGGLFMQ